MEEKKLNRFNFQIDPELHRKIKIYCANNNISQKDLAIEALKSKINDKPRSS